MTNRIGKSTNKLMSSGKKISSVDTYYVGKDTLIGEFPALRLLTREYANKKDAGAALDELRGQFPKARICEWQDLFDIDNPKEIIDDAKKVASARKDERYAEAKKAVVETLSRTMRGKKIPSVLRTFVIKCWAPFMAHIYLEDGENSVSWSNAAQTLRDLIIGAQPNHTWLELERIFGEVDLYFDSLKQQLINAPTFKVQQDEDFDRVWNWYRKLAVQKSTGRDRGESTQASHKVRSDACKSDTKTNITGGSHPLDDHVVANEAKPTSSTRLPPEVVVGNWFEIYLGDGKPKRHLKLTKVFHETPRLLFSDRKGHGVLEIDLQKFLRDLSDGKSVMIRERNHFDQALSRVIGSIRDNNDKRKTA